MRQDFVIIGAGVSGMTAAALLARHGYKVTLVEKYHLPAPTLRGFFRQGVYFDTGLHYTGSFAPGEILDVYFRFLGLAGIVREPYDPQCFDRLRYPGEKAEFQFPVGYDRIHAALCDSFPRESKAIHTYLKDIRADFESSPFLNVGQRFEPENLGNISNSVTLASYLDALTNNALLKSVLSMHSLLYGVSPKETAFSSHAKIVGSYYQSVHGIRGGGLSVVRAFEEAMKSAGVNCRYGNGAKHVLLTPSGRVRAVTLDDGEIIETDQLICTAHPRELLDLVPAEAFRPVFRRRIRELDDTPSAYMLFGIADDPVSLLERRNLFICPEADVDDYFRTNRPPEQGPWYVASAGQGGAAQSVVAIAPGSMQDVTAWEGSRSGKRPADYQEYKKKRLDGMRSALLECAPELESVRFVEGATPLTLRDYLHTPTGSLYGVRHSVNQFNPIPATRIPGLLLAGQSIVAPGLLGAMVSAFLTCGFVIGHDRLHEELRACV